GPPAPSSGHRRSSTGSTASASPRSAPRKRAAQSGSRPTGSSSKMPARFPGSRPRPPPTAARSAPAPQGGSRAGAAAAEGDTLMVVLIDARPPGLDILYRAGNTLSVELTWPTGELDDRTFTSSL